MSTINAPLTKPENPALSAGLVRDNLKEVHGDNYLTHTRGLWSWLSTVDHKRIGLMYSVGVLGAFFIGGVFALLLRLELINPEATFSSDPNKAWDFYNHMFTIHGAVMT
ncbi:MAG: cbb3-type cytochrome c oxidase subunit I, partial [Planctomycetota bacterium]